MGFKENLKSAIQYKGILVKELAAKSGVNKQTIDNYLSVHNSIPKVDIAVQLAQALGVSVEFLVTGSDDFCENATEDIVELVKRYKNLSPDKRRLVLDLVKKF
ncbi:MAG: helix-turn-helix transcriptional regulator [Treponema sp.]|nr:helix-turn-helix transcriptional regulator [Treponema sp.]